MKKISALIILAILSALTISGGAKAGYTSDYNFDAKLATNKTIPVAIEKTKINVPEISLTSDAKVLGVKGKCVNYIRIVPGEAEVDRKARLAHEAAEAQALADAQAQAEAQAQAQARKKVKVLPLAGPGPVLGDAWYRLRICESGNTYERNSGNGYYGAYQFNISTWISNAPEGWQDVRPDQAPSAIQDQAALNLYNARGWAPWPACSRKLGLR